MGVKTSSGTWSLNWAVWQSHKPVWLLDQPNWNFLISNGWFTSNIRVCVCVSGACKIPIYFMQRQLLGTNTSTYWHILLFLKTLTKTSPVNIALILTKQWTNRYNPGCQRSGSFSHSVPPSRTEPAPPSGYVHWRTAVTSHCSSWCRTVQSCSLGSTLKNCRRN